MANKNFFNLGLDISTCEVLFRWVNTSKIHIVYGDITCFDSNIA
jgi:hypothetical protein